MTSEDSPLIYWAYRVWGVPFEFIWGIFYGYPLCCIVHYALDTVLNRTSAKERGSFHVADRSNGKEKRYVPCALCKGKPPKEVEERRVEVKNAMLRTWSDERAVLTIVDENYELRSISGSVEALRFLLQDVELPNFKWVHSSDGRSYYAEGHEYKGRYDGGFALKILDQYRKKDSAA